MNDKLYLCGPIAGCYDSECKDWRTLVKKSYPFSIDPMRRDYRGREEEYVNEIVQLDKIDVDRCDAVIAYCPKPSVGTSMKILYAWQKNKKVYTVVPEGAPLSPWLIYHSTKICKTIEEALLAYESGR